MEMFLTAECTHICPESPPISLRPATEASSLLGMDPSVAVWSASLSVLGHIFLATEL